MMECPECGAEMELDLAEADFVEWYCPQCGNGLELKKDIKVFE